MLQDRKFYFPVTDNYSPWAEATDPMWETGPYEYLAASPWKVIGPAGTVTMDKEHPFTGAQTPVVHEHADAPSGISQDGLAVEAGKKYTGRIVLAGNSAGAVTVRLVLDDGKAIEENFDNLGQDFQTFPFEFAVPTAAENARLEIVGQGGGTFSIGTVSLMPGDNLDGWRADVIDLLKQLNSPVYRWPGGNFVSGYNWRDGLGDRDKRPPRKNPAWKGVEPNDVGIHEFMNLMKIIGSEPYVALNTGLGSVQQAADEVAYLNQPADGPIGKLRAQNGHPEAFGVKLFAVGNEMFGSWQLGHMSLNDYVKKHTEVTDLIWKVDPNVKLVAVGNVGEWDQTMLSKAADHMNYLSEHIYVKDLGNLEDHTAQLANEIARVAKAHRQYLEQIPGLKDKHVLIAMDEWNYWYGDYRFGELGCRYYLKDGLGVARGLHEYFRNSDLFFMANYAQTCNVIGAIKTTQTAASLEPTGLVLALYRNHFGTIPIEVAGAPKWLDVSAAWTSDRSAITIGIVNPTIIANHVQLPGDLPLASQAKQWVITGADAEAYNQPGEAPGVRLSEHDVTVDHLNLDVPPLSVVVYQLNKQ